MRIKAYGHFIMPLLLVLVFAITNGCDGLIPFISSQRSYSDGQPGNLTVATINGPFTHQGLESELLTSFAKNYNYKVNFRIFKNEEDAARAVQKGDADILSARLSTESYSQLRLAPGPSYEQTPLVLVCPVALLKKNNESSWLSFFKRPQLLAKNPRTVMVLQKDLWSDSLDRLTLQLSDQLGEAFENSDLLPILRQTSSQLFQWTQNSRNDCLISAKTEALYYLRYYPQLRLVKELSQELMMGFLLNPSQRLLRNQMNSWFQSRSRTKDIVSLHDRYVGHLPELDAMDTRRFQQAIQSDLSELKPMFIQAAKEFQLPWELIAAVAWQESQWQHEAVSFTGVKGLMMLTKLTAQHLGVEDRTDPQQSLWGGAKYLRYLLDRQPANLHPRERLSLALASYNIGSGHLVDAQNLAQDMGLNPQSWLDLKQTLPYLSNPKYAQNLNFGLARGDEPVEFTNRVLNFYDLLAKPVKPASIPALTANARKKLSAR